MPNLNFAYWQLHNPDQIKGSNVKQRWTAKQYSVLLYTRELCIFRHWIWLSRDLGIFESDFSMHLWKWGSEQSNKIISHVNPMQRWHRLSGTRARAGRPAGLGPGVGWCSIERSLFSTTIIIWWIILDQKSEGLPAWYLVVTQWTF